MKRIFILILSMGLMAGCVIAPVSLMAEPNQRALSFYGKGGRPYENMSAAAGVESGFLRDMVTLILQTDEKQPLRDIFNMTLKAGGLEEKFGGYIKKPMTLEDIRLLAQKGDELIFEDFAEYAGFDASSTIGSYIMVYGVEGEFRLIVNSSGSGRPSRADIEYIWAAGGSGIDIRTGDLDEFLKKYQ